MTPPPKDPPQSGRPSSEDRKAAQRQSQAIKPLRRPVPEVDDDDSPDEVTRKLVAQLVGARTTVDDIREQQRREGIRYEGLSSDMVDMNVELTRLSLRLDSIGQALEKAARERDAAEVAARDRERLAFEHRSKRTIAVISLLGMIAVAVITGLVTIIIKG